MKTFNVNVEFGNAEFRISAKNKREARKKAVARLKRMTAFSVVHKAWPSNRKEIDIEAEDEF